MQIKYRIVLGYTIIVTLLLSSLCAAVYYYSQKNKIEQFNSRLLTKARSTAQLMKARGVNNDFLNILNTNSASSLADKSLAICDASGKKIYEYNEDATQPLHIPKNLVKQKGDTTHVFFKTDIRDAVVYYDNAALYPHTIFVAAFDKDRVEWMSKLRMICIVSLLSSITIFFIIGFFFAKRVVRSISALTSKLTQISSEAFSARLAVSPEKDELQELATTINNLLDRLQSSFDTQRRLLSNASHELTTPLAAISSQLDVALNK